MSHNLSFFLLRNYYVIIFVIHSGVYLIISKYIFVLIVNFRRVGFRYHADYDRDRRGIRRRAYWKSTKHVVAHNRDSDDDEGEEDFQSCIFRTNFQDDMDHIVRKYFHKKNNLIFEISLVFTHIVRNRLGFYPYNSKSSYLFIF